MVQVIEEALPPIVPAKAAFAPAQIVVSKPALTVATGLKEITIESIAYKQEFIGALDVK